MEIILQAGDDPNADPGWDAGRGMGQGTRSIDGWVGAWMHGRRGRKNPPGTAKAGFFLLLPDAGAEESEYTFNRPLFGERTLVGSGVGFIRAVVDCGSWIVDRWLIVLGILVGGLGL